MSDQLPEDPPAVDAGEADADAAQKPGRKRGRQGADQAEFADPPRALIALHPEDVAVAIAVGAELRVLDRRTGELRVLLAASRDGAAAVRGVAFDPTGRWLAAGGDDKQFALWSCQSWECIKTLRGPKKISAVAFSKDGEFWLAGDKFGDVLAARTATEPAAPAAAAPGWELMLGHYCSLLTSVTVSATGRLVATTDRDQKVRVSVMPADPTQGAHSIQAYCFGHTAFVTCSAFARAGEAEVLLSGGGDGTLRMWDPLTGTALCSLELEPAAAAAAGGGGDAAVANAVLAVAVAPDGRHAVALVDGRDELCVVSLDVAGGSMAAQGWHPLPGLHIATSVCFDTASRVWAAGGPPAAASLCGFVACGEITAEGGLAAAAEGGGALTAEERAKLEARDGSEGAVLAEAAAGRRSHLAGYLRKRSVSQHEDESRKKEKFGERA